MVDDDSTEGDPDAEGDTSPQETDDPDAEDPKTDPEADDQQINPEADDQQINPEADDQQSDPEADDQQINPEADDQQINPEADDQETETNAPPKDWILNMDGYHRGEQTTLFAANMPIPSVPFFIGLSTIEALPILPKGFSPKINDAFFFEIDSTIGFRVGQGSPPFPSNMLIDIMVGVRYQLYLFEWLSPYAAFRGGVLLFLAGGRRPIPRVGGGVGAFFPVSDTFAFRLELGFPHVKAGFTFAF